MNPQTWTKVGVNRYSRFTASPDFWMFDPLKPPKCPLVSRRAICLAYIHSQMNMHMCAKFGANRSSRLTTSTYFWICDPLNPRENPPGLLTADLYLAYVHSQMNPQTSTKVGANRSSRMTASQDLNCWPPKTPKCPLCIEGQFVWRIFLYTFTYIMNLHMCANFGANRSNRLVAFLEFVLRLVRLLAAVHVVSRKNTPKNNIYTSKIIIPARTWQHQRYKLSSQQFS